MALTATMHNVRIALSDADRQVYETLDLRVARHPSETATYMLTRILAYCLFWEPDIAFSKGLSTTDEPAVWVKTLDGRVSLWLDVGQPSAERLHKASKAAARVAVCTHQEPQAFLRTIAGERIHRAEHIELVTLPKALLVELEATIEKRMDWEVVVSGGQLYVSASGATYEGAVGRQPLAESE